MNKLLSSKGRKYIYGVCIAAVPLAVYFGLLPAEASPVIIPLLLAILNINEDAPTEA